MKSFDIDAQRSIAAQADVFLMSLDFTTALVKLLSPQLLCRISLYII